MLRPRPITIAALVAVAVGFRLMPYLLHKFGVAIDPENTVLSLEFLAHPAVVHLRRRLLCEADERVPGAHGDLLAGDLGILAITGRFDWAFYADQPFTYLSVALAVSCGFMARAERSWQKIATAGLGAAVLFFVVSNFGTLGAERDVPEDLGRTGRVLRDGDSVLPQHADQHGRLPAAAVQPGIAAQRGAGARSPNGLIAEQRRWSRRKGTGRVAWRGPAARRARGWNSYCAERMPRSSISKISVAPGPIREPAPRSP